MQKGCNRIALDVLCLIVELVESTAVGQQGSRVASINSSFDYNEQPARAMQMQAHMLVEHLKLHNTGQMLQ
jgi:hypothetical protein